MLGKKNERRALPRSFEGKSYIAVLGKPLYSPEKRTTKSRENVRNLLEIGSLRQGYGCHGPRAQSGVARANQTKERAKTKSS